MARPVGLYNTPFGAASGSRSVETSVSNESEDRVFVRGVDTLVFEDFGCGNAVRIAGLGLCGFHGFIGRQSPGESHGVSPVDSPGRFKHRRNADGPTHGPE